MRIKKGFLLWHKISCFGSRISKLVKKLLKPSRSSNGFNARYNPYPVFGGDNFIDEVC